MQAPGPPLIEHRLIEKILRKKITTNTSDSLTKILLKNGIELADITLILDDFNYWQAPTLNGERYKTWTEKKRVAYR